MYISKNDALLITLAESLTTLVLLNKEVIILALSAVPFAQAAPLIIFSIILFTSITALARKPSKFSATPQVKFSTSLKLSILSTLLICTLMAFNFSYLTSIGGVIYSGLLIASVPVIFGTYIIVKYNTLIANNNTPVIASRETIDDKNNNTPVTAPNEADINDANTETEGIDYIATPQRIPSITSLESDSGNSYNSILTSQPSNPNDTILDSSITTHNPMWTPISFNSETSGTTVDLYRESRGQTLNQSLETINATTQAKEIYKPQKHKVTENFKINPKFNLYTISKLFTLFILAIFTTTLFVQNTAIAAQSSAIKESVQPPKRGFLGIFRRHNNPATANTKNKI